MSKHDVISDTLTALTSTKTFACAVKGWAVSRLIHLKGGPGQSCELCGTRFWKGAVVTRPSPRVTIVVGGTCLRTLQRHRFPPSFDFKKARQNTWNILKHRYGDVVEPGTWVNWLVEHAPPRLAQAVADLQAFGAALDNKELESAIRFHDRKRLFPAGALLGEAVSALESATRTAIPPHITIDQARRILNKAAVKAIALPPYVAGEEYSAQNVLPKIKKYRTVLIAWNRLTPLERRAVTALAALDEQAARSGSSLVRLCQIVGFARESASDHI